MEADDVTNYFRGDCRRGENNLGWGGGGETQLKVPFEEMRSRIIVQETRFVSFRAYPSGN